jgi:hypothetical protein
LFVDPHTLQYEVEENPHVEAASGPASARRSLSSTKAQRQSLPAT